MEEYRRDHPDIDESAIQVDLPTVPAKNAVAAPGVINPIGYPVYNPNPNPIIGYAHVYPHLQPVLPPLPPRGHARQPQQAVHHRQLAPQQPQLGPNTRARAAAIQEQKRHATANLKAERARMAEQIRLVAEENRARQRLDRVRDQRVVARREQQERVRLALELERQRQRERQRQPQIQPQQIQLQPQGQALAHGQAHQEPYHHHPVYHHQQAPQPQPPIQHFPALQNPFVLAYQAMHQQPPVMVPPQNPHSKGQGRRQ